MKLTRFLLASLGTAVLATGLFAQQAPGLKKIGISDVKPTPAIVESVKKAGRANSLDRVVQALDSQLIDRVQSTRKFEVIARSDLASILKDADVTGGAFKVNGVDYLLVTSIDDFQDFEETATFAALGKTATLYGAVRDRINALEELVLANSAKLSESSKSYFQAAFVVLIGVSALALAIVVALSVILTRGITRPLAAAIGLTRRGRARGPRVEPDRLLRRLRRRGAAARQR